MAETPKPSTKQAAGASPSPENGKLAPSGQPRTIGKYEILKKIGAGGMGAVYLALDTQLRRQVALKVLPRDKATNPTLVKRFEAEAKSAAALHHDNIVAIYEYGQSDGLYFIALEYVEGTDVANLVEKRGVIPIKRSLDIMKQITRALEHAHGLGIVHRDIKPANILIRRDGIVKLTDLGLARALDEAIDTSITRPGTTVGTVDYMAPEQAMSSRKADVRSDIYSLGCTWYHMLTGEPPFPDGGMTNKLAAHAKSPVPDPRRLNSKVPDTFLAIINRMMAKTPEQRYQTPGELLIDLSNPGVISKSLIDALSEGEDEPLVKSTKKPRAEPDDDDDDVPPTRSSGRRKRPIEDYDDDSTPADEPAAQSRSRKNRAADDDGYEPTDREEKRSRRSRNGDVDDADDVEARPSRRAKSEEDEDEATSRSRSSGPSAKPRRELPPREKRARREEEPVERDYSKLVWSGLVIGCVAAAVAIFIGIKNFASSIGFSHGGSAPAVRPDDFDNGEVPKAPGVVAPAVVATNTNPGQGRLDASQFNAQSTNTLPGTTGGPRSPAGDSKAVTEFLPDWLRVTPDDSKLPVLTVQAGGATGDGKYGTLNSALEAVESPGAVIQLSGRGPFAVRPLELADKGRIVLRPAESVAANRQPLIVAIPGSEKVSAVVRLRSTSLELKQVHAVIDAGAWKEQLPTAIFEVSGGDLTVRQSSATQLGAAAATIAAFHVEGSLPPVVERTPAGQVRALLQQVVVRGDNLAGLSLAAERSEAVIHRSLFSSGRGASIRLPSTPEPRADAGRIVRVATSTLTSRTAAFWMSGNDQRPLRTTVAAIDSLIAAPAGSTGSAVLTFDEWNRDHGREALSRMVTSEFRNTLMTGWERAVALSAASAIDSLNDWSKISARSCRIDKARLQSPPWPTGPADLTATDLALFSPTTIASDVRTSDNQPAGCPINLLSVSSLEGIEQARPLARRLPLPPLFESLKPGRQLAIDLNRDDLGAVLSGQPLTNGMEIVASGFGSRTSSPIRISGVWVRLRFEQKPGAPLTLAARQTTAPKGARDDAFITVDDGGLQLVGANLIPSSSDLKQLPRWLIQVSNGDLSLKNCRVQGPMIGTTRNKGLIQWLRPSPNTPQRPYNADKQGYLSLTDSWLSGAGTLIEADLRGRAIYARNSVIAARDDLLVARLEGSDPALSASIDFDHCTLSAAKSFLQFLPASLAAPATEPVEIFVDKTVFGPPLRTGTQRSRPAVLVISQGAMTQKQVTWWERRTGYAPDISVFIKDPGVPSAADQKFDTDWLARWGAESVQHPLVGPGGVILKSELPDDRSTLEPRHFSLSSTSKANTWDDGKPIGANVAGMNLAESTVVETRPAPQTPRKPSPKTKVGF